MTEKPTTDEVKALPWSLRKRLEFIEFRLFWNGKVNRSDLTEHFNISVPQASTDLAKYQALAPTNLAYDRSAKEYVPGTGFVPVLISGDSSSYLAQLLAVGSGLLEPQESFLSNVPKLGLMPNVSRNVDASILRQLVSAVLGARTLQIEYQSFSHQSPKMRFISPHALGNDGFRWHVRAFCHTDNRYKDFVLGRITTILESKPKAIDIPQDIEWDTFITLVVIANPKLSAPQIKAIEFEYGMEDGKLNIPIRLCLAEYSLKRLGIGRDSDKKEPNEQQILLQNKSEVEKALGKEIFFK